jgi:sulfite reductase (ferredoxin)
MRRLTQIQFIMPIVYLLAVRKLCLLDKGINSSTQTGIIRDFDEQYKESSILAGLGSFNDLVLQINKHEPSAEFAQHYVGTTVDFINRIKKEKEAIQS